MNQAIVTGCNLNYIPGVAGLLRSVRRFHPDVARYCLVPPGEMAESQAKLGDLAKVVTAPRPVRGVPDKPLLQLLAARTFIATFPADVVAWVDCDVVFCKPAPELWDVPRGKVNAVADSVYNLGLMVPSDVWDHYARRFPGVRKEQPGFNAGIYALRAEDWGDLAERYESVIAPGNFPYYPPGFDQPILNGLFLESVNWLPRAFNTHAIYDLGIPADTRIIHYTASPKPWMPSFGAHNRGYYEWQRYAEEATAARANWLWAYYYLSAPRRYGYRVVRKILTKLGFWRHEVGVANGPAPA
jgi:lipopolysaccharide biosynthesis glycosyltransferase